MQCDVEMLTFIFCMKLTAVYGGFACQIQAILFQLWTHEDCFNAFNIISFTETCCITLFCINYLVN